MKTTKTVKLISVLLALIMLSALFTPAFAYAADSGEALPLICLPGFAAIPIVANDGQANETNVFPPGLDSLGNITSKLTDILRGIGTTEPLFTAINAVLEPLLCDEKGTPLDTGITVKSFDSSFAGYGFDDGLWDYTRAYGVLSGRKIGADKVYLYSFDWRLDVLEAGNGLAEFIDKVLAETGAGKVNIVASSMGASVAYSYAAQNDAHAKAKVNNLIMANSAIKGTSLIGDLFKGDFFITAAGLAGLAGSLTDSNDFLYMLAQTLVHTLLWGVKATNLENNAILKQLREDFYAQTAIPIFANFTGLWSMIPDEDADEAFAFMFPKGADPEVKAKILEYYALRAQAEDVLSGLMDAGVKLAVISNYGSNMLPVVKTDSIHSDTVIDTKYTSLGATCSSLNGTLPKGYTQARACCGYDHVSPDNAIDASTCMFADITWFIKNLGHNAPYAVGEKPVDLIMWLLESEEQQYVWSNEDFPQFLSYDKKTGGMKPVGQDAEACGGILGFFRRVFQIFLKVVNYVLRLY